MRINIMHLLYTAGIETIIIGVAAMIDIEWLAANALWVALSGVAVFVAAALVDHFLFSKKANNGAGGPSTSGPASPIIGGDDNRKGVFNSGINNGVQQYFEGTPKLNIDNELLNIAAALTPHKMRKIAIGAENDANSIEEANKLRDFLIKRRFKVGEGVDYGTRFPPPTDHITVTFNDDDVEKPVRVWVAAIG